jgi:chitin disaccharide deacetylase
MSLRRGWLIVNADDFGRSEGINRGVAKAFEEGIVTSASLMVRWPAAAEAAAYAREHQALSVGLHFDLSEWCHQDGWRLVYRVVPDERQETIEQELERQLDEFLRLLGHPPTHLDSHQHVHLEEPARSALTAAGTRLGIPVRWCSTRVRYCGDFYGQAPRGEPYPEAITLDFLLALIAALSDGITELGCHPAIRPEAGSSYAEERPRELAVLRDPKVRDAIDAAGLRLISFAALGELIGAS